MATYQIHRLKSHLRQQFRFAPHVSGVSNIRLRDYEAGGSVDATSPYAAFFQMRDGEAPLEVGDVLELDGALRILKFVGFEEAQWVIPEAKPPAGVTLDTTTSATPNTIGAIQ
jgi:hypothetical protein